MLSQLSQLSIEADGRYATEAELQFLKDYINSSQTRISTYEKIRDHAEVIINQVQAEKEKQRGSSENGNSYVESKEKTSTCIRDMKIILRCSAAAILINDLDRMRNGILIWYSTIVRAFASKTQTEFSYQVLHQKVREHLTADEFKLADKILELNHSILR